MNFFLLTSTLLKLLSIVIAKPYSNSIENISPVTSNCEYNITDKAMLNNDDATFSLKNNFIFSKKNLDNIKLTSMQFIGKDNILIDSYHTDKKNADNKLQQLVLFNINSKQCNILYTSKLAIKNIKFNLARNILTFVIDNIIHSYNLDNSNKLINKFQLKLPVKIVDIALNYNGQMLIAVNKTSVIAYNINKSNLKGNSPSLLFKQNIVEQEDNFGRIKGVAFSLTKNILYIHGPQSIYTDSVVISYEIEHNISLKKKSRQTFLHNRNKILFLDKQQLIVSIRKHTLQHNDEYPDVTVSSWFKWEDSYKEFVSKIIYTKKNGELTDVTIDNNKNIIAFISSDNDLKIIQVGIANCNARHILFINNLVDKKVFDSGSILAFNNDTSSLAILGDTNLQIYSLNFTKLIKISDLNKCILPTKSANLFKPTKKHILPSKKYILPTKKHIPPSEKYISPYKLEL
jgi:hypothetical protein